MSGGITEPWGTPAFVEKDVDDVSSTTTCYIHLEYDSPSYPNKI